MEKLLNPSEVALILGIHEESVRRSFRDGRLPGAFLLGSRWKISESDLVKYIGFKKSKATIDVNNML